MLSPILLKCLDTWKEKCFLLMVRRCSTKWSASSLITAFTGKTINDSCGDAQRVTGDRSDPSGPMILLAVLINLPVEHLEWLHAEASQVLFHWSFDLLLIWRSLMFCPVFMKWVLKKGSIIHYISNLPNLIAILKTIVSLHSFQSSGQMQFISGGKKSRKMSRPAWYASLWCFVPSIWNGFLKREAVPVFSISGISPTWKGKLSQYNVSQYFKW